MNIRPGAGAYADKYGFDPYTSDTAVRIIVTRSTQLARKTSVAWQLLQ